jgi:hypothetical protein
MTTPSAFAAPADTLTFADNAVALADVFNACFDEDLLFRLSLTCYALQKALTPKNGFPIAFAIKNDFNAFNVALSYLRVIPSEETLEYAVEKFDRHGKNLAGFKYMRSHFVNSLTLWNNRYSTYNLKRFVNLKLLKVGNVYTCPKEQRIRNFMLCREKPRYYNGNEWDYCMKPHETDEEMDEMSYDSEEEKREEK